MHRFRNANKLLQALKPLFTPHITIRGQAYLVCYGVHAVRLYETVLPIWQSLEGIAEFDARDLRALSTVL